MAGERTPDTSPGPASSGTSSDNDISLREHMQRQIETEHRYFERVIDEIRTQIQQRDVAITERFEQALSAAEKAVNKAETANDKRFDSVNEFRAQLADQTATYMPRAEGIGRHDAADQRLAHIEARLTESVSLINSRLDRSQGSSTGIDKAWGYVIGAIGAIGGVVALAISFQ